MNKPIFYKPKDGFTADIIPFYDNNKFYLFYLHDFRNIKDHGEGTPWYCLSTDNFIDFVEHGEAIKRGSIEEQDLYIFTGCVIKVDGVYHIYYTGHNPHFRGKGKPEQAVMHATSLDMKSWNKHAEDTFYIPNDSYEPHDWRDPFIFYNEEEKQYWMILAARKTSGPNTRRGLSAKCVSKDLKKWEIAEPLWDPEFHYTHECPDVFKINDWWYLIYSEFSDQRLTRYRKAKDLKGPWLSPRNESFDGRAYYAAKSICDKDNKRYLFGWVPTKEKENDYMPWQWGGSLVVHELFQLPNGDLGQKVPNAIKEHFSNVILYQKDEVIVNATGKCIILPNEVRLPNKYRIEAEISFDEFTTKAGIALRYDNEKDESYVYLLDSIRNLLSFDYFPNEPWKTANFLGVNRACQIVSSKTYNLEIYVEGDVCTAYLDKTYALSSRMYNRQGFPFALVAMDGKASFKNIKVSTTKE